MGDLRITQQALEAAVSANADLRISQAVAEVLVGGNPDSANLQIAQQTVDILATPDVNDVRVTQVIIETLVKTNSPRPQPGWQKAGLVFGNTTTAYMNVLGASKVGYVQADILFVNTAVESLDTAEVPVGNQFPIFAVTGNNTGVGVALSSIGVSGTSNVQYVLSVINNGVTTNTNQLSFPLTDIENQRRTLRLEYKLSTDLSGGATDGWARLLVNGTEQWSQTNIYISMGSNTGDVYEVSIGNQGLVGVYDNLAIGFRA